MSSIRSSAKKRSCEIDLLAILTMFIGLVACFYTGTLSGIIMSRTSHSKCDDYDSSESTRTHKELQMKMLIAQGVQKELSDRPSPNEGVPGQALRTGPEMSSFAKGIAKTSKDDFGALYDYGNPFDKGQAKGGDVLMMYGSEAALPSNRGSANRAVYYDGGIPSVESDQATENCDEMKVALLRKHEKHECTVILNDYESYHIQRWLRKSPSADLMHVGRGTLGNGREAFKPPPDHAIKSNMVGNKIYLNSLDSVLKELAPLAKRVARENTIIVMTCNFGQSELLINFMCSLPKGLDIGNILLFPTDKETYELAKRFGYNVYYDEENFASIPSSEAKRYGDPTFVKMMEAKVISVQLINMLGYDVLFQDVDMYWYKDPLLLFHDTTNSLADFDIIFQDDGAHSLRYSPYSANSGFYYVRNNAKTRYMFTSFLYVMDLILVTHSHQQALTALLSEHSSLFGMKVKVVSRTDPDLPGGYHYHNKKDFMKSIVQKSVVPYIFHMSWTTNKENKFLFMQQMGMWHFKDQCVGKKVPEIMKQLGLEMDANKDLLLTEHCCSKEPIVECHYRDKPSIIPCKDSPPIDKGKKSFW